MSVQHIMSQCMRKVWRGFMGSIVLFLGLNVGMTIQAQDSGNAASSTVQSLNGDSFETSKEKGYTVISGNVRFIRSDVSVFCDELTAYHASGFDITKAIATGNVRILTKEVTATGDQGIFYLDEQKVELEGHARAGQGNNTITGHRIVAWLEGSAVEGYGSLETERVVMTIYSEPVEQPAADVPESGETAATTAPQQPSLIVIESDTLQYNKSQEYAVFTGTVNAQQDGMDIHADEMRVYLPAAENSDNTGIDRIEVTGNVRIVQDTIVITGADGVFDRTEQSAVITGTAEQQARAEDTANKSILNADSITILLESDDIRAEGNVSYETVMSEPTAAGANQ